MTARTRVAQVGTVLIVVVVMLVSCSSTSMLDGTSWRLVQAASEAIDPASITITATFVDGRIGGTSGVNTYGGSYTARADGVFSVGELMMTEMAGPEPAMRAEAAYVDLLARARRCEVAGSKLTLFDESGRSILVFEGGKS